MTGLFQHLVREAAPRTCIATLTSSLPAQRDEGAAPMLYCSSTGLRQGPEEMGRGGQSTTAKLSFNSQNPRATGDFSQKPSCRLTTQADGVYNWKTILGPEASCSSPRSTQHCGQSLVGADNSTTMVSQDGAAVTAF